MGDLFGTFKTIGAVIGAVLGAIHFIRAVQSRLPSAAIKRERLQNGALVNAIHEAKKEADTKHVLVQIATNLRDLELRFNDMERWTEEVDARLPPLKRIGQRAAE